MTPNTTNHEDFYLKLVRMIDNEHEMVILHSKFGGSELIVLYNGVQYRVISGEIK